MAAARMEPWLSRAGRFTVEKWPAPHPTSPVDLAGPRKGVLHTTEGSFESALDVFRQHYAPTFMVGRDRAGKVRILQFLPLGEMAAALENHYGGVETNREVLVQIEIADYSRKTPWLPSPEVTVALASLMLALRDVGQIPLRHTPVLRDPKLWVAVAGWLGHADVPENAHWDPGALRWDDLFAVIRQLDVSPPEPARTWPRPLPKWFWQWAAWRLRGARGSRPAVPRRIPAWAWRRLAALVAGRSK